MPELIEEMTYYADLAMDDVGAGPFGHRMIFNVTGGEFAGDRLKGEIIGAGADWCLVGPDGYGRLDVRATFKTHDDAVIYVQYLGILEVTPALMAVLGGGGTPTEFGDQYFFTNPRCETADERYAWLNQTVLISQGRVVPGPRVEYKVFRVAN
ncbi:MAG: DUF3237 domain-containing protein [Acidimicrobiia bacterium]